MATKYIKDEGNCGGDIEINKRASVLYICYNKNENEFHLKPVYFAESKINLIPYRFINIIILRYYIPKILIFLKKKGILMQNYLMIETLH